MSGKMEARIADSWDTAAFIEFCTQHGDDVAEDVLTRICEAHWADDPASMGVEFRDIHQHDACNHTLSGTIEVDGVEYGFIVDNGNWAGTVVREWGLADDVGTYDPPKPVFYTFVPKNDLLRFDAPGMWEVYLSWRGQKWFQDKEHGYNYDKHFAPGSVTTAYYTVFADKKGMKIATMEFFEELLTREPPIPKADFDRLVQTMEALP